MNTKKTFSVAAAALALAVLGGSSAHALAVGGGVNADIQVEGKGVQVTAQAAAAATTSGQTRAMTLRITNGKDRADKEIDRRVAALTELTTKINAMEQVSPENKASLSATLQTQITALASLKAKIDADADINTLKTDIKSITESYRIYMLVIPQGHVVATADAAVSAWNLLNSLAGKLDARIAAAQAAGTDVSAETKLMTDMKAKMADAQVQAQASVSAVATLTPDNGDKTVMQANKTALAKARAALKAGREDLKAARQDAQKVVTALGKMKVQSSTTASSTTTVQ
jgi:hypothetical protein